MPVLESKLPEEEQREVAECYSQGASYMELSKKFGCAPTTIRKYCKRFGAKKPPKPRTEGKSTNDTSVYKFAKRARKVLWRQNSGGPSDRVQYNEWNDQIEALVDKGMNKSQATVQASKDFDCLHSLFSEFDLAPSDPNPESHPNIQTHGRQGVENDIECEGVVQSHRENLAWAIEAAGRYLRTGEHPAVAPNDAAYFLYTSACNDPREFLGKFTQVDLRGGDDGEEERLSRKSGERSIEEINSMLEAMLEESSQ